MKSFIEISKWVRQAYGSWSKMNNRIKVQRIMTENVRNNFKVIVK